jgi:hypothetical protein
MSVLYARSTVIRNGRGEQGPHAAIMPPGLKHAAAAEQRLIEGWLHGGQLEGCKTQDTVGWEDATKCTRIDDKEVPVAIEGLKQRSSR